MRTRALVSLALFCFAVPAVAQDLSLSVGASEGASVIVSAENTYEFDVTLVNVRITLEEAAGTTVHYFSGNGLSEVLAPGASWEGSLTFAQVDGTAPDEFVDWDNYQRMSAAVAVDIDAFSPVVQAALDSGEWDALGAQLAFVKSRTPPISRAARFHEVQIAATGMDINRYFDLERVDAMRESLEDAICDNASNQIMSLRGSQDSREEQYNVLSEAIRAFGLHINCMNSAGKLAAARMLISGDRPQDALLFKETDDEGNLLPEWVPIYTIANLALARTAAELGVTQFSSIRPALEALNNVHDIDPENADLLRIAAILVPNAAGWVESASGPINRDIDGAQDCLEMIRPRWSRFEQVETAASAFADALIEAGIEYCERREYINSRNRFIRGARILEGVPQWDARADEINRCRALGALDEGRELANHPTDDEGPSRGFEKLEEAQGRFDLTDEDVTAFKADIASAWTAVAVRQLTDESGARWAAAEHSLDEAEAMSPTGRTDAMREAWILYAETMYAFDGMSMTGAEVDVARAALEKAENGDPDRRSAIAGKLTMAFYGYRIGIPAAGLLLLLLAGVFALINRRKAKKFDEMAADEI
jgi:hypothetical protein